jgi:hypothetical protein
MTGFAEKLAARSGGGSAPSWMDRAPDLLMAILPMLLSRMAAPTGAPASLPAPGGMPGGPMFAPAPPAPAAPVQEVDESMLQGMGIDPSVMPFIKVGQRAIKAYQDGYSGAAFAELVERVDGEQVYAQVYAVGKDTILQTLRRLPAFLLGPAAPVVASPQFETWLDEFFAYGNGEGDTVALSEGGAE